MILLDLKNKLFFMQFTLRQNTAGFKNLNIILQFIKSDVN